MNESAFKIHRTLFRLKFRHPDVCTQGIKFTHNSFSVVHPET